MGEHADDMLNGLTCANCGEWMDDVIAGGDGPGHPRLCSGCGGAGVDADDAAERGRFTVTFERANGHDRRAEERAIIHVHATDALSAAERKAIDDAIGVALPRFHHCPYCERSRFRSIRDLGQHAYHAHQRKVTKDGGPTS